MTKHPTERNVKKEQSSADSLGGFASERHCIWGKRSVILLHQQARTREETGSEAGLQNPSTRSQRPFLPAGIHFLKVPQLFQTIPPARHPQEPVGDMPYSNNSNIPGLTEQLDTDPSSPAASQAPSLSSPILSPSQATISLLSHAVTLPALKCTSGIGILGGEWVGLRYLRDSGIRKPEPQFKSCFLLLPTLSFEQQLILL